MIRERRRRERRARGRLPRRRVLRRVRGGRAGRGRGDLGPARARRRRDASPDGNPHRAAGAHGGDVLRVDVHRAARICEAGHGGQILTSAETARGAQRRRASSATSASTSCAACRAPSGSSSSSRPASRLTSRRCASIVIRRRVEETETQADARRARGGLGPPARGDRAPARGRRLRRRRPGGERRRAAAEGSLLQPGRRDRRHPHAADAHGRRAAAPRRRSARQHPETGVLVLSQYVEAGYAMELLSESAEGVGYLLKDRVSDVEEFRAAVRRVAEGGSALDPADRLAARRPSPPRRPDRRADAARARGARADGGGAVEPGDRRAARRHGARDREARHEHLRRSCSSRPAPEDHRRVLAVLAFLRS